MINKWDKLEEDSHKSYGNDYIVFSECKAIRDAELKEVLNELNEFDDDTLTEDVDKLDNVWFHVECLKKKIQEMLNR